MLHCCLRDQPGGIIGLTLAPDGSRCVTWNDAGELRFCSGDARIVLQRHAFNSGVGCVSFSPDGTRIAAGGSGGRVVEFDAGSGTVAREITIPMTQSLVRTIAYAPDGRSLAAGRPPFDTEVLLLKCAARPHRSAQAPVDALDRS